MSSPYPWQRRETRERNERISPSISGALYKQLHPKPTSHAKRDQPSFNQSQHRLMRLSNLPRQRPKCQTQRRRPRRPQNAVGTFACPNCKRFTKSTDTVAFQNMTTPPFLVSINGLEIFVEDINTHHSTLILRPLFQSNHRLLVVATAVATV
jgi:hypothetical protein